MTPLYFLEVFHCANILDDNEIALNLSKHNLAFISSTQRQIKKVNRLTKKIMDS